MSTPLNDKGVDLSNVTAAADFLQQILDDSEFQTIGNGFATDFWYVIGAFMAIAAVLNIPRTFCAKMRIKSPLKNRPQPTATAPSNVFKRSLSRTAAFIRWLSYAQYTPASKALYFKIPQCGTLALLLGYLGLILSLEFYQNDTPGAQHYTALGLRAAWLGISQIPLLILLAGKNNLVGFFIGVSYVRLNIFHRWVARSLLLTQTLHFGFQAFGWSQYGLLQLEWKNDTCFTTGVAAYVILLWMNISTLAPIRNFSYEFFVVQHILTFFGFIIAIMMHLPATALYSRTYIYIGIGIYCLDRLVRTVRYSYHNYRPARATLIPFDGATKIRISSKQVKKWSPGSHILISIPRLGFGQSHPATIASIPSSHQNDLVLILKAHNGFTKRIMLSAGAKLITESSQQEVTTTTDEKFALIDGPYGGSHPDFATFDTVLLISASTGVTFTLPIILDLAHRASSQAFTLPVQNLEFVWVVKKVSWISWVSDELRSASQQLLQAGINTSIHIYVTDEENMQTLSATPTPLMAVDRLVHADIQVIQDLASWATLRNGRPSFKLVREWAEAGQDRMGVAVCGPVGLSSSVRNIVAGINKDKALGSGIKVQSITLHTEGFSW